MEVEQEVPSPRKRFSLRFLFGLIACIAIGLGIWKTYLYKSPTDEIAYYDKAPSTRSSTFRINSNTITIRSMARNRRDGSVVIQAGDGKPLTGPAPDTSSLATCAAWLDVVQLEIAPGPDLCEIVEVRVFDHQSRRLLSQTDPAFGWRLVAPNLVQVYGAGKEIPSQLDVWFCVHSFPTSNTPYILAPTTKASVSIGSGEMKIREIQDGFAGWNSKDGFAPASHEYLGTTALDLEWNITDRRGDYRLAAIGKWGEKQFRYERYSFMREPRGAIPTFHFRLHEIDHFEVRPFQHDKKFYYDAVEIPKNSGGKFAAAPTVAIPVKQAELELDLVEFSPLQIRLKVQKGDCICGHGICEGYARLLWQEVPRNVDQSMSLSYRTQGVSPLILSTSFADSETGRLTAAGSYQASITSGCSSGSNAVWGRTYFLPLDRIEAIEVSIPLAP